jgi:hypothetical protein
VEADLFPLPGRRLRRRHQLPDGAEDYFELGIVFPFQGGQLTREILMALKHLPQMDESPVFLLTFWPSIRPLLSLFEIANCDLKVSRPPPRLKIYHPRLSDPVKPA